MDGRNSLGSIRSAWTGGRLRAITSNEGKTFAPLLVAGCCFRSQTYEGMRGAGWLRENLLWHQTSVIVIMVNYDFMWIFQICTFPVIFISAELAVDFNVSRFIVNCSISHALSSIHYETWRAEVEHNFA